MLTRQFFTDGALAAGLLAALTLVLIVDRRTPPLEGELVEGEEVQETKTLIGTSVGKRRAAPRPDSIYAERVAENREEVARKRGATPISERAVQQGLEWLARHQAPDGSWSSLCLGSQPTACCTKPQVCDKPGVDFAVAQTGLALLAFQGGGHFWFNESPFSSQVKRGLDWLIERQRQDGCFISGRGDANRVQFMYEHSIATFALAEACALAKHSDEPIDSKHQQALEKAIKFIENCQDKNGGGWRYAPGQAGDTSVSGWVVLALKSAQGADLKIDDSCLRKCLQFFESCEIRSNGRTAYTNTGEMHTEATTGVGMLVHHFLLGKSDTPLIQEASRFLADHAEQTWGNSLAQPPDYYIWYNCTLGMYLAGGQNWDKWNGIIRSQIEQRQVKADGPHWNSACDRGSWPPDDRWGQFGGRIYSTALAILTLEVYYRFAKKDDSSRTAK